MKPLADCRLYTFVDAGYLNNNDPVEIVARQLIDGGTDILQLRAKDWSKDRIQSTAESLLQITESAQVHWSSTTILSLQVQPARNTTIKGQSALEFLSQANQGEDIRSCGFKFNFNMHPTSFTIRIK